MKNVVWRVILAGFVLLLVVTCVAMFLGAWVHPDDSGDLPSCPYIGGNELVGQSSNIMAAIGAYEAIRETLKRHSTEGLAAQTAVIEEALSTADPRIASCAKRLGAEKDIESARRAFMRMHRLMEKHVRALEKK